MILIFAARGIDGMYAAELCARLAAFAEDWDTPEMDIYNDYDAVKVSMRRCCLDAFPAFKFIPENLDQRSPCKLITFKP